MLKISWPLDLLFNVQEELRSISYLVFNWVPKLKTSLLLPILLLCSLMEDHSRWSDEDTPGPLLMRKPLPYAISFMIINRVKKKEQHVMKSHAAAQEITHLVWKPQLHCEVHKSPALHFILIQLNSVPFLKHSTQSCDFYRAMKQKSVFSSKLQSLYLRKRGLLFCSQEAECGTDSILRFTPAGNRSWIMNPVEYRYNNWGTLSLHTLQLGKHVSIILFSFSLPNLKTILSTIRISIMIIAMSVIRRWKITTVI